MWRRNGDTLVRNAWFYRSSYFYDFGFDLDIFLLQVCACCCRGLNCLRSAV
jgi:hypothetical protein